MQARDLLRQGDLRGAAAMFVKAARALESSGRAALVASQVLERAGDAKGAQRWALEAARRFARQEQETQALAALKLYARLAGEHADREAEREVLALLGHTHARREPPGRRAARLLDAAGWISALGERLGDRLLAEVEEMRLEPDEVLVREGEPADALFFVAAGALSVRLRRNGREIVLGTILPGDAIGEIAYFHDRRRSADVVAIRPSRLLRIPFATVERLRRHDPAFAGMLEKRYQERLLARLVAAAPVLETLPAAARDAIIRDLEPVEVRAGEFLLREGEATIEPYLVRSTRFAVTAEIGGQRRWIKEVGPGGLLGEIAALVGKRTASAQALEDGLVYRLPAARWRALLDRQPKLREALEQRRTQQLRETRAAARRERVELHRLLSLKK